MAPSAIETQTEVKPQSYKLSLGNYKDIDTTRVNRDVEEGKTGEVPAKVRFMEVFTWPDAHLILIVSQLPTHVEPRPEVPSIDRVRALRTR